MAEKILVEKIVSFQSNYAKKCHLTKDFSLSGRILWPDYLEKSWQVLREADKCLVVN
jgi:hypothetical protein